MKQRRLVQGVGVNDAPYVVQKFEKVNENGKTKRRLVWMCPYYSRWLNMLHRVYSVKEKVNRPTYEGCTVCTEWLIFSNFKAWMETQDWDGKQLDKDLLIPGNKVYSPENCVFVSGQINNLLLDHAARRGDFPIGVDFYKKRGMFRSRVNSPFECGSVHIGYFNTPDEAHEAWKREKHIIACTLADECVDSRIQNALRIRYK